jgi:hypothetical protein
MSETTMTTPGVSVSGLTIAVVNGALTVAVNDSERGCGFDLKIPATREGLERLAHYCAIEAASMPRALPCRCDGHCRWHGECDGDLGHGCPGGVDRDASTMLLCDVCFVGHFGDMIAEAEWDGIAARRGAGWTQAMFDRVRG